MKKSLALVFLALLALPLPAKKFSFGIEGGAGINTAFVKAGGLESDFDFIPTFRAGAAAEWNFNQVTALQLKALFHHNNGFSFTDQKGKTKVSFMTVDIPLLLKLTFAGIENIPGRFAIFAGPNFSFKLGGVSESSGGWTSGQKRFDSDDIFAAGLECGAEYAFSKENGFRIGLSVLVDLSDFSKDKDFSTRRLCATPYLSYYF